MTQGSMIRSKSKVKEKKKDEENFDFMKNNKDNINKKNYSNV